MRFVKYLLAVVVGLGIFSLAAPSAHAQVRFGVGIGVGPAYDGYYGGAYSYDPYDPYYSAYGPPPDCVYGYYPTYPYACAPYGYWGPDYFYEGVFVGVGPWFGWRFGPGFRGWFRNFDDFRRFGGFRGERFHSFWGGGGYREFRGVNAFRGGNTFRGGPGYNGGFRGPGAAPGAPRPGGNTFRGNVPPGGNFRAAPPSGGFRGQVAPHSNGGFSGGAPRAGGGFHSGGGGGHVSGGHGGGHR